MLGVCQEDEVIVMLHRDSRPIRYDEHEPLNIVNDDGYAGMPVALQITKRREDEQQGIGLQILQRYGTQRNQPILDGIQSASHGFTFYTSEGYAHG